MASLSIGEVSRRAGVAASAIRYYEEIGVLPVPQRRSGRRHYDASVIDRLSLIDLAQQAPRNDGANLFASFDLHGLGDGFAQLPPVGRHARELPSA